MTTELSRTEDQCAFSGAVMSTESEVSTEKKDCVFEKITIIFFNLFVREKGKYYLNIKGAFHSFQAVTSERNTCQWVMET